MDLYRRDRTINFSEQELDKKYFVVPIKLTQKYGDRVRYEIDKKFIVKVAEIAKNGYKNCQPNILDWMSKKSIYFASTENE